MRLGAKARSTQSAANLLAHYTNACCIGRNCLEDGFPDANVSVDDLKKALGPKALMVLEKVNDLVIDDEDEKDRVRARADEREKKRIGANPPPLPEQKPQPETPEEKRLKRRRRS